MLSVGVDIIEIERIKRAVLSGHGQKFLKKIYTSKELEFCQGKIPELAVRFAGKEAVSKALGIWLLWLFSKDLLNTRDGGHNWPSRTPRPLSFVLFMIYRKQVLQKTPR